MIKIDYEGAWKELKNKWGFYIPLTTDIDDTLKGASVCIASIMKEFEQKHTHDFIELHKRSDKEIADYCLKKHAEVYLELVCLKQKLRKLSKRG